MAELSRTKTDSSIQHSKTAESQDYKVEFREPLEPAFKFDY